MAARLESLLYRVFRFNPAITLLELRTRLRGQRPYGMLFFFAFIGTFTLILAFLIIEYPRQYHSMGPSQEGSQVLVALFIVQLTLVLLIMPAYGASTIAMERDRKTLELVQTSLLSATDIVSGKLMSVAAFGMILLMANLPVAAWCLMLGGVNLQQLYYGYTYLVVMTIAVTALGLLISALFQRTITAVVVTYGVLIACFAGLPLVGLVLLETIFVASSRQPQLGPGGSTTLVLLLGAVVGAITYMALRGVTRRYRKLNKSLIGIASPAVLAIAAGGVVILGAVGIISSSSSWNWHALLVAHPYVGMFAMVHPEMAEDIISSSGVKSAISPSTAIWLIDSGIGLLMAALLWFLAISAFRWKSRHS